MMKQSIAITLLGIVASVSAFCPTQNARLLNNFNGVKPLFSSEFGDDDDTAVADGRNPDRPELPEIKGDYDWDAKFAGDEDWITENVPGRIVLNEIELAAQATALAKIEESARKLRLQEEYDDARILGWTGQAETFNGRFAMFFLVVGLLTEYWTGITIPGQIEEMLRVGGFIGPDF